MTGLDCLREELEKRGLNKAQINSKVAAAEWLDLLDRANRAKSSRKEFRHETQKGSSANHPES